MNTNFEGTTYSLDIEGDRVGIFPGTFNPIHLGHIRTAQLAMKKFQLSKVIFLPCGRTKRKNDVLFAKHRYNMIKEMVKDKENLFTTDVEVNNKGYSNIADTFYDFKTKFGKHTKLFFIMGNDILNEMGDWPEVESVRKLLSVSDIICLKRKCMSDKENFERTKLLLISKFNIKMNIINDSDKTSANPVIYSYDGNIITTNAFITEGDMSGISSTLVRKKSKNQECIVDLVGGNVEKYIKKFDFYSKEPISKIKPFNPENKSRQCSEITDFHALNLMV